MRVVHILDHSIPRQTAYAARTLATLKGQRALGWETFHLTGPRQGPGAAREEEVNGWLFHRTPSPGGILEGIPGVGEIELMGEIAWRIEQVARRVHPHVLHAHSPALNVLPALWVARRLGIPVAYEMRAPWEDVAVKRRSAREGGLRYRALRALETWALKRVDAVATVCEALRAEIVARGVAPGKVTVVPHAVDAGEFPAERAPDPALRQRLGLADAELVLGFVGCFHERDGVADLLRASRRLVDAGEKVRVLLVGSGAHEGESRRLAAELGLGDRTVFAGDPPPGELDRYYDLIDIFVYPRLAMRLFEVVTPFRPLEAMAHGGLVIASDLGGHRDLIRPGDTGELFAGGDPDALARAVMTLRRDTAGWPARRAAARRYVQAEHSATAVARRYGEMYARLTGAPRPA
ncbi:MAG: glycosyltransferase, exosortase A system-associated [Burkholderiales bacterium]|nr:glycosyltransferase, exosortase A system-associated [Burkholderiales bacterium]